MWWSLCTDCRSAPSRYSNWPTSPSSPSPTGSSTTSKSRLSWCCALNSWTTTSRGSSMRNCLHRRSSIQCSHCFCTQSPTWRSISTWRKTPKSLFKSLRISLRPTPGKITSRSRREPCFRSSSKRLTKPSEAWWISSL